MTITIAPTTQPPHWAPSPSPSSPSPTTTTTPNTPHHHQHQPSPPPSLSSTTTPNSMQSQSPPPPQSKLPVDFSPPLIAMVVIVAAAFLVVTYSRLISRHLLPPLLAFTNRFRRRRHRHRRRPPSSVGDMESPPFDPSAFHALSPYGLDDSAIKTIPISLFTKTNHHNNNKTTSSKDSSASACCCCAVCLIEFEDNDYVRTLPACSHAFHVDCIDVWLRSHANCPLCRAGIFAGGSPFIPVMASRIRPSFVDVDDSLMLMTNFMPLVNNNSENSIADSARSPVRSFSTVTEITPCAEESPRRSNLTNSEERRFSNGGCNSSASCRDDMLLKRSYSFGFERSLAEDRMLVMEPSTASPWRHRRNSGGGGVGFWSKRLSPFATSLTKSRVFSFRHYRGGGGVGGGMNVKYSPFFTRRRGGLGFFPLSERFNNISGGGGGGGSSRRSKSLTSPLFMRSSASATAAFSSSRLRCGDPEALLSPERFNRR